MKPIVSFDRVYQTTTKALGVSYTSVHRIMNDKRRCKSNRPKERANILDDFDHCVIKRTIHGIYSRKIAPTVSIIHKEIKDSSTFSIRHVFHLVVHNFLIITYFFISISKINES
jgi:hypothetical protein